jgi:nucleoid DNA-binding protein
MAVKQMTKNQLATHLAERFGISKKTANEFLDEFAVVITQTRKTGVFTMPESASS